MSKTITSFVGLDVHDDSIAIGVAPADGSSRTLWGPCPRNGGRCRRR